MDSTLNTDFIWQVDSETGNTQATEVIEHTLHTITSSAWQESITKFNYNSSSKSY